jgi:hypothetical protein
MKNILFIAVLLLFNAITAAQNVVQAEYFIDADAGVGKNTLITLNNPQADGNYNLNINLTGLAIGYHKLYIRTKDSDGNWSFTARRNIEITSSNAVKKIIVGEYFFDTDPGVRSAASITVTPQDSVILQNFTAATNSLSVGYHKLYIRLKDNDGNWSLTARRNVEVTNASTYVIAGVEYFFNTDPGAGSAASVTFITTASDSSFTFKIPLSAIATGAHTLYIRARDSVNRNWSIPQWQKDSVVTSSGLDSIWSHPATWSNNKVPDANTVVLLHHKVYVDITTAVCKSLAPYRNDAQCIVMPNMKVTINGHR